MQLIINDYGAFIGRIENVFVIKNKNKKTEISANEINQIKIITPSSLSYSAVKLAVENSIDIVFLDRIGNPFARIYPCKLGGTTLTRRKQLEVSYSKKGVNIVKTLIYSKIANQLKIIKSLSKTRNNMFKSEIEEIQKNLNKIKTLDGNKIEELRSSILGIEGYAASLYFSCISKITPLEKRDYKSKDLFNLSLNYGYGILYSEIERCCILVGLDPYLGFFHTDRYGKPCLVLDIIEPFRPFLVDKPIINLFVRKQIDKSDLEFINKDCFLTKKGRTKIIKKIIEKLNSKTIYKNKKITIQNLLLEKCRELVRYITDQSKSLKPLVF